MCICMLHCVYMFMWGGGYVGCGGCGGDMCGGVFVCIFVCTIEFSTGVGTWGAAAPL